MPFPLLPAGAVVAAAVLVAALSVFGLVLRAMDRAIVGLREPIVPGLVAGLRTWNRSRLDPPATISPETSTDSPWRAPDSTPHAATAAMTERGKAAATGSVERFPAAEVVDLDTSPIEPGAIRRG